MAYERQNWVNGETIATAERMNHIEDGIADLYNAIFPIGQIVIKGDNEDYTNWLGFTWERTAVGKVLVGIDSTDTDFNQIGKTAGAKEVTLTIAQIPSHAHSINGKQSAGNPMAGSEMAVAGGNNEWATNPLNTQESGGNQPHNNLQPYQVVAYWKRIA